MAFLVELIIVIFLIFLICKFVKYLFKKIIKKENVSFKRSLPDLYEFALEHSGGHILFVILIIISIIVIIFSNNSLLYILGNRDLEKMPNGKYIYYVNFQNENSEKIYTIPALIEKDSWYIDDGEVKDGGNYYYVRTVYFSNGNKITFDNDDNEDYNEKIGGDSATYRKYINYGDGEHEYYIEILNKKAYVPNVKDKPILSYSDIIIALISCITLMLIIMDFVSYLVKHKK